jgi:hypothetical protein
MIIVLRSVLYAAVLWASSFYCLIANAASGPNYGNGPSVFVPFVNAPLPPNTQPKIRVGFPNGGQPFTATMDTGSVGFMVGSNYFTPPGPSDPTYIGPGTETLNSSDTTINGYWYSATVILYSGSTNVATSTVPVLAVTQTCTATAHPGGWCPPGSPAPDPNEAYLGIGFGPGSPQGTPDKNVFLNVTGIPSPGYTLSAAGVQIGLNAANTQGFALIKLEPLLAPVATQWQNVSFSLQVPTSPNLLTDWQHMPATITVNGVSTSGTVKFDTGVSTGILTPPVGLTVPVGTGPTNAQCSASYQPTPSCAVTGTHIQVAFPSRINPVASLNYTIGPNNGPQNGNPISPFGLTVANTITPPRAPFLNTSVAFLQAFDYLYDAANGFLGLKALTIAHILPARLPWRSVAFFSAFSIRPDRFSAGLHSPP